MYNRSTSSADRDKYSRDVLVAIIQEVVDMVLGPGQRYSRVVDDVIKRS